MIKHSQDTKIGQWNQLPERHLKRQDNNHYYQEFSNKKLAQREFSILLTILTRLNSPAHRGLAFISEIRIENLQVDFSVYCQPLKKKSDKEWISL